MRDDDDGFGTIRGGCVWLWVSMLPDKTRMPVSYGDPTTLGANYVINYNMADSIGNGSDGMEQ